MLFSYTISTIFVLCAFADNPQAQRDDNHFLFLPQNQDFIGKQALLESLHPSKHLVHLTLLEHDDNNFPWGGEVILRNGSFVGSTTSACYSFRDGRPVCLGYLVGEGKNSSVPAGDFQIEIAGSLFSVSVTNL